MRGKDLLSMTDLDAEDIEHLLHSAVAMKQGGRSAPLEGKTLALLFEKPSLRTRVSFDIAMQQLGGHALYLSDSEVGLGKREPVSDMARVLSRYVDSIVARTYSHTTVQELAHCATVPVINGLSDEEHPCQALSDLLTIYERKGKLKGLTIAFIGDGNNVARSLLLAASLTGANFRIASPEGYGLKDELLILARGYASRRGAEVFGTSDPVAAAQNADVVYTDVWTSMGQESQAQERRRAFARYQVNARLLMLTGKDTILMHPLPAHHGEELAEGLLESPQSVVFDQAENRLHMQKAILLEVMRK